jgi:hypothetical protein
MKKIIFLLFTITFVNCLTGQTYIVSTPTINSQISWNTKIITKVTFSGFALGLGHSFTIDHTNKIINLTSCYSDASVLPVVTPIKDTINIGMLMQGVYNLNYTVFVSSNSSSCIPHDTTIQTYTFYAGPNNIQELSNDNKFLVSPNPVKDSFKIITSDNDILKRVEIINILGDKVLEINEPTSNNYIDISFLEKGFYLVNIYTDKSSFIKKIIKE